MSKCENSLGFSDLMWSLIVKYLNAAGFWCEHYFFLAEYFGVWKFCADGNFVASWLYDLDVLYPVSGC